MVENSAAAGVTISEASHQSLFLVTKSRTTADVADVLSEALGYPAPERVGQCAEAVPGGDFCLKFGPHQYLMKTEPDAGHEVHERLVAALAGRTVVIFDFAGGLKGLKLAGPGARDLLSKGTLIDLRDATFPPGAGTRALFAGQPSFIIRKQEGAAYEVYYDGSLEHAMQAWFAETSLGRAMTIAAVPLSVGERPDGG